MEGARVGLEPLSQRGGRGPGRSGQHDHVLVIEGRHARRDRPPGIGLDQQRRVRLVRDRPVTAVAVKEVELGEDAVPGPPRIAIDGQDALQGHGLADGPQPGGIHRRLALHIVGVDVVVLLEGGEKLQLERQSRMARAHHLMGHELVRLVTAPVAIEADIGTHDGVFERRHTPRHIVGVADADGVVAGDPASRRPMAALAADAVGNLEAGAAHGGGLRMATQTGRRVLGRAQTQPARDGLRARIGQGAPGPAVRSAGTGGVLPADQFVLAHDGPVRGLTAMAGRAGAGRHALVNTGRGQLGGGSPGRQDGADPDAERQEQGHARPDRNRADTTHADRRRAQQVPASPIGPLAKGRPNDVSTNPDGLSADSPIARSHGLRPGPPASSAGSPSGPRRPGAVQSRRCARRGPRRDRRRCGRRNSPSGP